MDGRTALIYLDLKHNHVWDNIYSDIMNKVEPYENESAKVVLDTKMYEMLANGYKVVTLVDKDDYPEAIKNAVKPPFVIWYKCKLEDLSDKYFERLRTLSAVHIDDRVLVE